MDEVSRKHSERVRCGRCGVYRNWIKTATGKIKDSNVISYCEMKDGYIGYICKPCFDVLNGR